MNEESNPLWMPKGSVRSLMALSVLVTALFMWATGREMPQAQELLTTGVVGGYFVLRQMNSGAAPPDGGGVQDLMRGDD